jgi:2-keto-3-deoxy-L-fuconate dehydrogenase
MFDLHQKTVIVTGGGSGIGKAISVLLARRGAVVFIADIDTKGAASTVAEIEQTGGLGFFHPCNIALQKEVEEVVQKILLTRQRIDILINNAGIAHVGSLENTLGTDVDRLLDVNVKGMFYMLKAVVPGMKKDKAGVILNMASIASRVGLADRFAYSMTKGAVVGMTLSVARDYLEFGIRCNCISPARVHTPFVDGFIAKNYPGKEKEMFEKLSASQPIGRMGRPEEIAALALYLCSEEASFITGCDYPIDGGYTKLNT